MGSDFMSTFAMVVVQVGFAGLNVVSKLAMDDGMSPFVLIAYRQIIATFFLCPLALFVERKAYMKITGKVLFQTFLCSIFGATSNQILYFVGLKYSTPTIACALSNMLPAITFVMAVPFRMETVGIRTLAGQAKLIGTVLCVGGSMLMTFYRGSLIKMWQSPIHWRYAEEVSGSGTGTGASDYQNLAFGAVLVIASCFTWAIWFIIQANMSKGFASPYTSSAMMCLMASFQCLVVAAGVERKASAWSLGWNIRLIASLYIGLICSGLAFALMSWCIESKGPLYVSMFSPLQLVIVAVLGWAILDEKLDVGIVTGSVIIVVGLYLVLWGKGKEIQMMEEVAVVKGAEVEQEEGGIAAVGLTMFPSPPVFASPARLQTQAWPTLSRGSV